MASRKVDFVVVGGVEAVLQGAPVTTFDLDVVHSRRPNNVERLLAALREVDAVYRERPDRKLAPTAQALSGPGRHLLLTSKGPLDVLGQVGGQRQYEDLLLRSIEMRAGPDLTVRVLDLPTLIALKEELGREKDVAALTVLRRTPQEPQGRG